MGEVWRAHDARLSRDVAIKLSSRQFSDRFEREARSIAALNHPNICTLFDVGPNYLVMELIEGRTLADRIAEGPIPMEEALAIARQITDALEAAHEKNIVHRDLKPGNIKVRPDGSVKVLDFGLATGAFPNAEMSHDSPTMTMLNSPSQVGVVLGTAAYMAPEQARGKAVDKRADIWSFGVVLYEMVTGKCVFLGEDLTETLASVVKSDPNLAPVPKKVRRLISKCLQKDFKKRLRDIGDAWELLGDDDATENETAFAEGTSLRWPGFAWAILAGVMTLVAAGFSFLYFREKPAAPRAAMQFQIHLPQGARFEGSSTLILSPDGRHIAFPAIDSEGAQHLFVQDLNAGTARELSNTEISGASPPPWWSPDGAYLAYSGGATVDKAEVATGLVQSICEKPGPAIGGSWNRDGTIIFGSTNNGLWRVPASGGKAQPLTKLDASRHETSHQLPSFLPDGRHYIFLATSTDVSQNAVFARSIDDAPDQASRLLVNSEYGARFAAGASDKSGWLLYSRGSLMAQPFNTDQLTLSGEATGIPAIVATAYQTALFSASPELIVYRSGSAKRLVQFEWIDAKTGRSLGKVGEPGVLSEVWLSPNEKYVAYTKATDGATGDIWVLDLDRGTSTRLTFGGIDHSYPSWSADGSLVLYSELVDGAWRLVRKRVDGTGGEEAVLTIPGVSVRADGPSPDGRYMLIEESKTPGFAFTNLFVLPLEKDAAPLTFSTGKFAAGWANFSPDGHYIAYASSETGRYEVYVQTFPQNPGGQPLGKWIVSKDGGRSPAWSRDGKKLVWEQNGSVWSAAIDLSHGVRTGTPEQVYRIPNAVDSAALLTSKGRGLLLNTVPQIADESMNVIVDWAPAPQKK
jgi:Tol biopolymer transport system component